MSTRSKSAPVPDRRHRKRIVTLKNFRNLMFVAIGLFAVVSVYSELRPQKDGDYGRLFARKVRSQEIEVKSPEVVTEAAPVDDAISPDPFSVNAAAREQILRGEAEPLVPQTATDQTAVVPQRSESGRIAIVGGAEGVAVVQKDEKAPVLGGGFGRRQ